MQFGGIRYIRGCAAITTVHFYNFFIFPKEKPVPPRPPPPPPWQPPLCCLSPGACHSEHFLSMESDTSCAALGVWLLSLSGMFLKFVHVGVDQGVTPFCGWITSHVRLCGLRSPLDVAAEPASSSLIPREGAQPGNFLTQGNTERAEGTLSDTLKVAASGSAYHIWVPPGLSPQPHS